MLESMPKKPTYPQQELADRLQAAMEESEVNLADLARACGVTIQAVHGWRETGRIGKQHLVRIAQMTKKPLEYFLVGLGRAAAVLLAATLLSLPATPEANASSAAGPVYYVKSILAWWRLVHGFLTGALHSFTKFATIG